MNKFILFLFIFVTSISIQRTNDDPKISLVTVEYSDYSKDRFLISTDQFLHHGDEVFKLIDEKIQIKENEK